MHSIFSVILIYGTFDGLGGWMVGGIGMEWNGLGWIGQADE